MSKKYIRHEDPGHSWLEVKRAELKSLSIEENISGFSCQKGDSVFLEEDSDESLFWKRLDEISDGQERDIEDIFYDEEAPLREYAEFAPKRVIYDSEASIDIIWDLAYCFQEQGYDAGVLGSDELIINHPIGLTTHIEPSLRSSDKLNLCMYTTFEVEGFFFSYQRNCIPSYFWFYLPDIEKINQWKTLGTYVFEENQFCINSYLMIDEWSKEWQDFVVELVKCHISNIVSHFRTMHFEMNCAELKIRGLPEKNIEEISQKKDLSVDEKEIFRDDLTYKKLKEKSGMLKDFPTAVSPFAAGDLKDIADLYAKCVTKKFSNQKLEISLPFNASSGKSGLKPDYTKVRYIVDWNHPINGKGLLVLLIPPIKFEIDGQAEEIINKLNLSLEKDRELCFDKLEFESMPFAKSSILGAWHIDSSKEILCYSMFFPDYLKSKILLNRSILNLEHINLFAETFFNGRIKYEKKIGEICWKLKKNLYQADLFYKRGMLFMKINEMEKAYRDFTLALTIDSNHKLASKKLSNFKSPVVRESMLNFVKEEAERITTRAIENEQDGIRNEHDFKLKTAFTQLNLSLLLNPDQYSAFIARGRIYFREAFNNTPPKNYQKAFEDFEKAMELDPSKFEAFFNRAAINKDLGNTKEAIKDFLSAIEKGSGIYRSFHILEKLYAVINDPQIILEGTTKIIEMFVDPNLDEMIDLIDIYKLRADTFRQLGKDNLAQADEITISSLDEKINNWH